MKKIIALLSALTMVTAFVGCSSNEDGSSSEAESTTTVAETTETTTAITTKIEPATTTNSPEDFELGMPFKLGNMSADMPTNLLYYEEELDSGTMAYYWRSNEWIIQIYNEPILNSDTDAEYLLALDTAFGKKEDYEKNFSTIDGIGCLVVKTKANNQIGYTIALNGQCYSIIFTCTNTSDIENIVKPIVDSIKFDKT
ncbi:MAG: hypothetical protein K2H01_10815, partial [Ruminococcus sp.]|nr:hypothetical protein [Ruminococcus sp.]